MNFESANAAFCSETLLFLCLEAVTDDFPESDFFFLVQTFRASTTVFCRRTQAWSSECFAPSKGSSGNIKLIFCGKWIPIKSLLSTPPTKEPHLTFEPLESSVSIAPPPPRSNSRLLQRKKAPQQVGQPMGGVWGRRGATHHRSEWSGVEEQLSEPQELFVVVVSWCCRYHRFTRATIYWHWGRADGPE